MLHPGLFQTSKQENDNTKLFVADVCDHLSMFLGLTLGLAGDGLGLFFTSIQDSESRSGRLAERPFGIVLRLEISGSVLVCGCIDVEDLEEPAADTEHQRQHLM